MSDKVLSRDELDDLLTELQRPARPERRVDMMDAVDRSHEELRAQLAAKERELEKANALLEGLGSDRGTHGLDPTYCPTFYDQCHCTVDTLAHNIKRAVNAEQKLAASEAALAEAREQLTNVTMERDEKDEALERLARTAPESEQAKYQAEKTRAERAEAELASTRDAWVKTDYDLKQAEMRLAEASEKLGRLVAACDAEAEASTMYFAHHGVEHSDDECPQDDTCECPEVWPMCEAYAALSYARMEARDLLRTLGFGQLAAEALKALEAAESEAKSE